LQSLSALGEKFTKNSNSLDNQTRAQLVAVKASSIVLFKRQQANGNIDSEILPRESCSSQDLYFPCDSREICGFIELPFRLTQFSFESQLEPHRVKIVGEFSSRV
jgi:hypothetical protein